MCGSLETYISDVSKEEEKRAKDGQKVLKSLQSPLKEGHHFDQALGGIQGLFEISAQTLRPKLNSTWTPRRT